MFQDQNRAGLREGTQGGNNEGQIGGQSFEWPVDGLVVATEGLP